ncbi:hypothetical protein PPERSA_12285 [Pseudocohnilembus persalinus]|uniref:Uncharacterized protein n=1 Tax=Pseudocohnilembus persalinus TaxID=266149 RepID=A0A0V0R4X9_PSEPJ|nr:hypothetical protein PPERSA_12285 [Pseudocohnilembus persalinus]|eukprot:KRX09542.1 hypothetical protein PPERSA_12285 [Pseudocohnilembus persalinus]
MRKEKNQEMKVNGKMRQNIIISSYYSHLIMHKPIFKKDIVFKNLEDSNVYVNISHCYILLHLYQLGLDACIEGLKLNPQQKVLWNNKASALIKLGRLEDVLEAIEKHLEIDPENEYLLSYKQKISQKMEQRNLKESKDKNFTGQNSQNQSENLSHNKNIIQNILSAWLRTRSQSLAYFFSQ